MCGKSYAIVIFTSKWYVRGHINKLRFANSRALDFFLLIPILMITDKDNVSSNDDADKAILPVRRRSRSRNREDEGMCGTNSPRRSERPDAVALQEQQAVILDGLQTQSRRWITLGNMDQQGADRQTRLEQTASNIAGPIQTVLEKIDTLQRQLGRALSEMNRLCSISRRVIKRNHWIAKLPFNRNRVMEDSYPAKKNWLALRNYCDALCAANSLLRRS